MKRFCIIILLSLISFCLSAQDFQCMVSVNSNQVASNGNQQRYQELQQKLYEFIHERKWCQYNLKMNERIECAIQINLTEVAGDEMKATVTLLLQRTAYKTNYKTTLLNFQDKKVEFTYADGDPLEYAENSNIDQFTSLIAFYLNMFLAVEFDSYSMYGGEPYYNKMQSIVNLNQTSKEKGWSVADAGQSNRYWLTENLTNTTYAKLREFYYQYHRLGLDIMSESPDAGRAVILESLKLLQQVHSQKSNLAMVKVICASKIDEIINIFKDGMPSEKTQVVNLMKQIDPTNSSKYDAINGK